MSGKWFYVRLEDVYPAPPSGSTPIFFAATCFRVFECKVSATGPFSVLPEKY